MFCTFTLALSAVCVVQCPVWLFFAVPKFCAVLVHLLRYCLGDYEMVPFSSIITSITFTFTFHMRWISIMRSLYFKIFTSFLLITFLSPGIATSINMHVPCLSLQIMMSGFIVRSSSISLHCWFHNVGNVAFITCFDWFWYMVIPMLVSNLACFLAYVKM